MGSGDHQFHPRKPMALDVTIIDPHGEEEAKEVSAAMQIHQSLLVEVWDDDTFKKDLLGEAWLPPLGEVGHHPRDYVLPLGMPNFGDNAENGPSRKHKSKEVYDVNNPKDKSVVASGEVYVKVAWEFPLYEMTADGKCVPKNKEGGGKEVPSTDRAKQNEMINTGRLTLTIDHARNLRRSDASKGRDCDPQVNVYLRNDILETWRVKPLLRTKTVKNDRNPRWKDEVYTFEVMQGEYESRFPPKDKTLFESAKTGLKTRRQKRHEEEERQLLAVKRFGEGLKIRFGSQLGKGEGENHGIEVFVGDSIREFKAKLTEACARESMRWAQNAGADSREATKYSGTKIEAEHLVMVFVPPPKLTRLVEEGNRDKPEYKHAYTLAIEDPNNWDPLDPTRTFDQYNPRFGFGRPEPAPAQVLRVCEATEKYKMTNLRYKEFAADRAKKLIVDMNEEEKCFGWAKYQHAGDSGSFEWRPAIIGTSTPNAAPASGSNAPAPAAAPAADLDPEKTVYSVSWLVKPAVDSKPVDLDRASVLMAPQMPKMDHYVHPKHMEVLKQARGLRQIGKSDYDIEIMLNKILEEQNKAGAGTSKESMSTTKPPRITVEIVKKYMAHS